MLAISGQINNNTTICAKLQVRAFLPAVQHDVRPGTTAPLFRAGLATFFFGIEKNVAAIKLHWSLVDFFFLLCRRFVGVDLPFSGALRGE